MPDKQTLIFIIGTFALFTLFHFVITFLFFIQYRKKRNSKERLLIALETESHEKQLILLEQKQLREKLEIVKGQINHYVADIRDKVVVIKELKEKNIDTAIISKLQNSIILTENDWLEFRSTFNQIYPSFIKDLTQEYPKITKGEKRLLVLAKLELSISEMSEVQGVSSHAIRVTWYRFRDKVNFKGSLEQLVMTLN